MATKDFSTQLGDLYSKMLPVVDKHKSFGEKDIRFKHLQLLAGEILFGLYSLTINEKLADNHSDEFQKIFEGDN